MEGNILSIIEDKYESFSKTNKQLAIYIREHANTAAFLSIKEMEAVSGVSVASISRFVKEIGFQGYADFQKHLAGMLLKNVTPMQEIKDSITRHSEGGTLKTLIEANQRTLAFLYSEDLQKNFDAIIEQVKNLQGKLYITASRSSFCVAYFLHFMLKGFMPNVELLVDDHSDISHRLLYVTPKDMLIAISYSRYTRISYELASFFRELGCCVVSITDSYQSPVALCSNFVLLGKNIDGAYAFAGAMTLANSLVTALGQIDSEQTLQQMKRQDTIALAQNLYL